MEDILSTQSLSKTYERGVVALDRVSLTIRRGEIFALLGPNGAGKTTCISIISGLVKKTSGTVAVDGHDIETDWRAARRAIGLVPQEIRLDIFLSAEAILNNQRGFHGKPPCPKLVKRILEELSLWDKRTEEVRTLSGGMKRRVLIAKALVTEPKILFLDEPTAGVDVELRKDMWDIIRSLKENGTTIVLTTHYIEEAELLADRIGIINTGKLILVEEKTTLMKKMGEKTLAITLAESILDLPSALRRFPISLSKNGRLMTVRYSADDAPVASLLAAIKDSELQIVDVATSETSLEDIFVHLTHKPAL